MPRLASDMNLKPKFKEAKDNHSMLNTRYSQKFGEQIKSQDIKPSYKRSVMSPTEIPQQQVTGKDMIE